MRTVRLPGGRTVTVRPVTADDVDGLRLLYEGLSAEDRYRRFFSQWRPNSRVLQQWAAVSERGGFGLVAVVGDAAAPIVGEACYTPLSDGDGEFALVVAREWRGWLGYYLLDALCEAAAARGVPNLQADVLTENGPMLAVLRARGYAVLDHSNFTTVRVAIGTARRIPSWPGSHEKPRVVVEVPGGHWLAEGAVRAAGYQVVGCPEPLPGPRSHCPALRGERCPLASDADLIVFALRAVDPRAGAVLRAHTSLHAGVPVCAELSMAEARTVELPEGVPRIERGAAVEQILDLLAELQLPARRARTGPQHS